jgi:hypothetical protein
MGRSCAEESFPEERWGGKRAVVRRSYGEERWKGAVRRSDGDDPR